MKKLFVEGNYFFLEIPGKPEPLTDFNHRVYIFLVNDATKLYRVISAKIGHHDILLSEMIDENDNQFTQSSFESFFENYTGPNALNDYQPGSINIDVDWINCMTIGTRYAICGIRPNPANIGEFIEIAGGSVLSVSNDDFLLEIWRNPTIAGTFSWDDIPGRNVQEMIANEDGQNTLTGGTLVGSTYVNQLQTAPIAFRQPIGEDEYILTVVPLSNNLDIFANINFKS